MTPTAPIVIIGAGPAGLTLAYLLVSNGRAVRVLERHPDFEREFRGELVQPSSLRALAPLGVLDRLVREGLAVPDVERRMFGARPGRLSGGIFMRAFIPWGAMDRSMSRW